MGPLGTVREQLGDQFEVHRGPEGPLRAIGFPKGTQRIYRTIGFHVVLREQYGGGCDQIH